MCLVEKEFQSYNKKVKSLRAWFEDDGFPTEKPDSFEKEKRNTALEDPLF